MDENFNFEDDLNFEESEDNTGKPEINAETENTIQATTQEEVDISDVFTENFKKYIGDDTNYIILDKNQVIHFVRLVNYHAKLGFDVFSESFKMDASLLEKEGTVSLTYNNGSIIARSTIKVVEYRGSLNSYTIGIDTLVRLFPHSKGNVCIFEESDSLYGYLFGGRVFLETYVISDGEDITRKEYLMEKLGGDCTSRNEVDTSFIDVIKKLNEIVMKGSRIEERTIYSKENKTYIYAGIALGQFEGLGMDIALQIYDINSLISYFMDVDGAIIAEEYSLFYKFSFGTRDIFFEKRKLDLSDDMKYKDLKKDDSISLNVSDLKTVIGFLGNMGNNTGIAEIIPGSNGIDIKCNQKSLDHDSRFPVKCNVKGGGITGLKLPLQSLRMFLKVFDGIVTIKTNEGKLYIEGEIGKLMIFGNE